MRTPRYLRHCAAFGRADTLAATAGTGIAPPARPTPLAMPQSVVSGAAASASEDVSGDSEGLSSLSQVFGPLR